MYLQVGTRELEINHQKTAAALATLLSDKDPLRQYGGTLDKGKQMDVKEQILKIGILVFQSGIS